MTRKQSLKELDELINECDDYELSDMLRDVYNACKDSEPEVDENEEEDEDDPD